MNAGTGNIFFGFLLLAVLAMCVAAFWSSTGLGIAMTALLLLGCLCAWRQGRRERTRRITEEQK